MPYYTISYGQDPSGANVGNSYSKYIIGDLLRERFAYDGVDQFGGNNDKGPVLPWS